MNKLSEIISNVAMTISDHGNALVSKLIHSTGLISIGTVGGAKLAETTGVTDGNPLEGWALIISMTGGILFIIKLCVDMYYSNRRNKREEEAHNGRNNQCE